MRVGTAPPRVLAARRPVTRAPGKTGLAPHRSRAEDVPVSFLRVGRGAMLPLQPGGAKVMPRHRITPAAQRAGCEAVHARANKRAADLAPIIAELRAVGITSFNGIA
jgi:hypothetical protein